MLRILQALGHESELQGLFVRQVGTIAQMEQAAGLERVRAPRKNTRQSGVAVVSKP